MDNLNISPCPKGGCLKGIPPAYRYPYHSKGYQAYPQAPKPLRIPSGLRKSIEQERRASLPKRELEKELAAAAAKRLPLIKTNIKDILFQHYCPPVKDKPAPPKQRKQLPGISNAYHQLKENGYLKPPCARTFRREKYSVQENKNTKDSSSFPLYESPSYLASVPRYRFTPKKVVRAPSVAEKQKLVHAWGRTLIDDLNQLKGQYNHYDKHPFDHVFVPENRINWGCEQFRNATSKNIAAWYNLMKNFVVGPTNKYFFNLTRVEVLECWERMQAGNYMIKDCCVDKPTYEMDIPYIPSLRPPPKKSLPIYETIACPCRTADPSRLPSKIESVYASKNKIPHKSTFDREMESILMNMKQSKNPSKAETSTISTLGESSKGERLLSSNISNTNKKEETLSLILFEKSESNISLTGNFKLQKVESITNLNTSVKPAMLKILKRPKNLPPFCDPIPAPENRLPWHIPPLKPRDGDDQRKLFQAERSVSLEEIISVIDDPYGEQRRTQRKEMLRKIRLSMLSDFFHRVGLPGLDNMECLMRLDIPESHPLHEFKLRKGERMTFKPTTDEWENSIYSKREKEADVQKQRRRMARKIKPNYSKVKSKFRNDDSKFRTWI